MSPRTPIGDIAGFEDVPYWPLTQAADVARQFGVPGSIDLVAGAIQPVAIVGDTRGQDQREHAEIFSASGWVAANAGDSGLFEFHHPAESGALVALNTFLSALFEYATGSITSAARTLIQGETTPVTKLVVILDVCLSVTSITNAAGAFGGCQWINPGFGSAPVIIDVLPFMVATGGSYRNPAGVRARGRLWAGRRNDSSALPLQNPGGAVMGSSGPMCMLSLAGQGAQPWRPFENATPFLLLPGRGFAIGFGTFGVGQQTNVQAACSVVWKEIEVQRG